MQSAVLHDSKIRYVIKVFDNQDRKSVAILHSDGIRGGFLSKLPLSFLSSLYQAIAHDKHSVVFTANCSDFGCCGFVVGTRSTKGLYKRVLLSKWPVFALHVVPSLIKPSILTKVVETLCYPFCKKKNSSLRTSSVEMPDAELLSIVVTASMRRQGIGRMLVNQLDEWFRNNNCSKYSVITVANDENSNAFYRAVGFIYEGSFTHHENTMNRYIRTLF